MSEENVNPPDEEPISLVADDAPISLVDTSQENEGVSQVKMIGGAAQTGHKAEFKRPMNLTGSGATRFRMFRTKLAIGSLESMEAQINEWLDGQKIEVKQVCQTIGIIQAKTPEPNLIITVWY